MAAHKDAKDPKAAARVANLHRLAAEDYGTKRDRTERAGAARDQQAFARIHAAGA